MQQGFNVDLNQSSRFALYNGVAFFFFSHYLGNSYNVNHGWVKGLSLAIQGDGIRNTASISSMAPRFKYLIGILALVHTCHFAVLEKRCCGFFFSISELGL